MRRIPRLSTRQGEIMKKDPDMEHAWQEYVARKPTPIEVGPAIAKHVLESRECAKLLMQEERKYGELGIGLEFCPHCGKQLAEF